MAKVVRFHEFGGPETLRVEELDVGPPGRGEVRIRVGAIGLNRVEAQYRAGLYLQPTLPSTIGYEAAGVIESIGPDVGDFAPGDRVATLTGAPMDRYGTYGESIRFPAGMLVRLLPGQSLVDAAACWMQYFTAYGIIEAGAIGPGNHVVITAASSSVGLAAIQMANAEGATPIAVTRGAAKKKALLDEGAAHVIVSEEEDIAESVMRITNGAGARVAFDAVGGATLSALAECTAMGGILIYYGVLAGPPINFPWMTLLGKNLTVRGYAADLLTKDAAAAQKVTTYVNTHLASGAFRPVIDRTFALDQIADAHRYLESNQQFGKIIITTSTADE